MLRRFLADAAIFVPCSVGVMVICVCVAWVAGWSLHGVGSTLVVLISVAVGGLLAELIKDVRRELPGALGDDDEAR